MKGGETSGQYHESGKPIQPTENTSCFFVSVVSRGALLAWPGRRLLLLGLVADWDALATPGTTPGGAAAAAAGTAAASTAREAAAAAPGGASHAAGSTAAPTAGNAAADPGGTAAAAGAG